MKRILLPISNRVHLARLQLLIAALMKDFELHICNYGEVGNNMSEIACDIAPKFKKALDKVKPDLALIKGDRFEQLPLAMMAAYGGYKVAQIEAGDLSGVIDNRVRFAISHLADYHFATNSESEERLLKMGFKDVFNTGSLDVEYALTVEGQNQMEKPSILILYHPIPDEPLEAVLEAVEAFRGDYDLLGIKSNHDYGTSTYKEEYRQDEFIRLLKGASCLVGNSSAGIKEVSVLGTPSVIVGSRQANRLRPPNVIDVLCEKQAIINGIRQQLEHGKFPFSSLYYQPNSAQKICDILKNIV